jgi:hypothetical protein
MIDHMLQHPEITVPDSPAQQVKPPLIPAPEI